VKNLSKEQKQALTEAAQKAGVTKLLVDDYGVTIWFGPTFNVHWVFHDREPIEYDPDSSTLWDRSNDLGLISAYVTAAAKFGTVLSEMFPGTDGYDEWLERMNEKLTALAHLMLKDLTANTTESGDILVTVNGCYQWIIKQDGSIDQVPPTAGGMAMYDALTALLKASITE
jgi:hypothetical protein